MLWPEHFDVAIALDEVTYGVSAGDDFIGVPYVYVSPFTKDGLDDEFWNVAVRRRHPADRGRRRGRRGGVLHAGSLNAARPRPSSNP